MESRVVLQIQEYLSKCTLHAGNPETEENTSFSFYLDFGRIYTGICPLPVPLEFVWHAPNHIQRAENYKARQTHNALYIYQTDQDHDREVKIQLYNIWVGFEPLSLPIPHRD